MRIQRGGQVDTRIHRGSKWMNAYRGTASGSQAYNSTICGVSTVGCNPLVTSI